MGSNPVADFHFLRLRDICPDNWFAMTNRWVLHSLAERATHRCRGCHGLESHYTLQPSNVVIWEVAVSWIACTLRRSFHSFHVSTAVHILKTNLLTSQRIRAQTVEHYAGITEVMGLNPAENVKFFKPKISNCLYIIWPVVLRVLRWGTH